MQKNLHKKSVEKCRVTFACQRMFELGYVLRGPEGGQWTIVDSDYRNPNSTRRDNRVQVAERHLFDPKHLRPELLRKYRFGVISRMSQSTKEEISTRHYRICQLFPNWQPEGTYNGLISLPINWAAVMGRRELLTVTKDGRIQTVSEAIDSYKKKLGRKLRRERKKILERNLMAVEEITAGEPIAYGVYDPDVPGQLNEVVPVPLAAVRMNEEVDGQQVARFYVIGLPDEMLTACLRDPTPAADDDEEEEEEEEEEEAREAEGAKGGKEPEGDGENVENAEEEEEVEVG